MLMYFMFNSASKFIEWVGRYDMHSTFFIANGCVGRSRTSCALRHLYFLYNANRHNRLTIIPHRRLAIHDNLLFTKQGTLHAVQLRIPG